MRVAVASFTAAGAALAEELVRKLRADGDEAAHNTPRGGSLSGWVAERFALCDALVFVGATGIAVRAVAPHLRSKLTDPAVVSLDERGGYIVPLVSGHIGGANALARRLAGYCGGVAVVSTATDLNGVFAVDSWAAAQRLRIANPERIRRVSGKLLAGGRIAVASDWPIAGDAPQGVDHRPCCERPDVAITLHRRDFGEALVLVPQALVLGIGCRRGTPPQAIAALVDETLEECALLPLAVGAAASIDLKANEPGLGEFCAVRGLRLTLYSAGQLGAVAGTFTSSAFVRGVTGVDNVCERAAVLRSGGELVVEKQSRDGVTLAVAQGPVNLTFADDAGLSD